MPAAGRIPGLLVRGLGAREFPHCDSAPSPSMLGHRIGHEAVVEALPVREVLVQQRVEERRKHGEFRAKVARSDFRRPLEK